MVKHFRSQCQKGHGSPLPVFRGAPMQYGHGIGSFFGKIFRKAVPLVKDVWKLVKPHAANAAKNVFNDVMSSKRTVMAPMPNTQVKRGNKRRRNASGVVRKAKRVKRATSKKERGNIF